MKVRFIAEARLNNKDYNKNSIETITKQEYEQLKKSCVPADDKMFRGADNKSISTKSIRRK